MSAAAVHQVSSLEAPLEPGVFQGSAAAVHQISSITTPSETGDLTPVQAQVVAALAAGTTVIRAAAAAGVHRTTIHNWLRSSKEFRDAVEQARGHYDALIADRLNELSTVALDTLRQLLTSPETPPAVRLRAALAVLGRPTGFDRGWQLPVSVGRVAIARPAPQPAAVTSAPRNAPCPCGSGLKYKHCCGTPEGALVSALLANRTRPQGNA
jgi:hypothetical protein